MRILWLKTEFLHPVDKGGRIRTYQMLREIAREHHVTYLTLDDGEAAPDALEKAAEYAHEVITVPFHPPKKSGVAFYAALLSNVVSSLPYAVARYQSAAMSAEIQRRAPNADLLVCDFLTPAINMRHEVAVPTVLFQHNVEAMIWERHAAVSKSFVRRSYMREQWRRMVAFEKAACHRFDHVIAVSPQDADVMRAQYGAPRVSDVPTGVDTEFFTPAAVESRRLLELVFTGSMDWMPNDDAMLWFLDEILPLVRAEIPEVTVTIVGRSPSTQLQEQARSTTGVEVTGRVPDVRPYLDRASVFLVPIRIGGGTRLKIFEAMAMGLPVLSTTVGAEGLPLSDGNDVLLRDTASAYAAELVSLLRDDVRRRAIAEAGQRLVRERYGWAGVAQAFMAQCAQVVARAQDIAPSRGAMVARDIQT